MKFTHLVCVWLEDIVIWDGPNLVFREEIVPIYHLVERDGTLVLFSIWFIDTKI